MKNFIIMLFMILFLHKASGQNQKIKFTSINQVGLLSGNNGDAWMLQTINGLSKDKWFAGIGTGLDFYNERTIPLFIEARRNFTGKKNTPFAYAGAGLDFVWLNTAQRLEKQAPISTSPGLFYDLGIGWKLSGKNNRGFILSAGYSFKQVKEKVKGYGWIAPTSQLEADNYQRYNYLYRRVVIKVGIEL